MPETGTISAPERAPKPLRPGIHAGIEASVYHADPCAKPSLSASIAKVLCTESPLHAWTRHPRLNPAFEREEKATYDVGTAAHAMLLEGRDVCVPVDAADWRTKDAKEKRDEIRKWGRIPLLKAQWETVNELVDHTVAELAGLDMWPLPLTSGKPEQTLVWREGKGRDSVTCRGLVDWLRDDLVVFDDLKTTSRGANPLTWSERRVWDFGLDVQGAFYQRGLLALTGELVEPRFVVVESVEPFAVSVLGLAPSSLAFGHEKVEWAIDTWRRCMKSGKWPGYTQQVSYVELPAWQASRWMEERFIEEHGTPEAMT